MIRDDIIPVLKTLNPEAERHWTQFTDHAKRATLYLDQLAAPLRDQARGPLNSLKIQPMKEAPAFLRQWAMGLWLTEHGLPVDSRYIAELEAIQTDQKTEYRGQLVIHEAGSLWAPVPEPDFQQVFCAGDHLELAGLDGSLKTGIIEQKKTPFSPLIDPRQVAFDADQLHLGLEVRPWRQGDRFHPFGLQGSVKVGDLFTNLKIPKPMREHWPLVVCGDVIIWVVGLRRGSSAPMSSETAKVLYMENRIFTVFNIDVEVPDGREHRGVKGKTAKPSSWGSHSLFNGNYVEQAETEMPFSSSSRKSRSTNITEVKRNGIHVDEDAKDRVRTDSVIDKWGQGSSAGEEEGGALGSRLLSWVDGLVFLFSLRCSIRGGV